MDFQIQALLLVFRKILAGLEAALKKSSPTGHFASLKIKPFNRDIKFAKQRDIISGDRNEFVHGFT